MGLAATAIELDEQARRERRAGSLTLPYRVVVHAKLVLLAADGLTSREIACRVDMSADRVGDWRRRFAADGIDGLEDKARRAGQGDCVRAAHAARLGAVALQQI